MLGFKNEMFGNEITKSLADSVTRTGGAPFRWGMDSFVMKVASWF